MSLYRFLCPNCGQKLSADSAVRSMSLECPTCHVAFTPGGGGSVTSKDQPQQGEQPGGERRMSVRRHSMGEFVARTEQQERGEGVFELESERLLEVNLSGRIWLKIGAMVAYRGDVRFTRERLLEFGLGKLMKRSFTGEGAQLSKAEGTGTLYLADGGKKITILALEGESLLVNGNSLLAFEEGVAWDVVLLKGLGGVLAGGFFNLKLSGHGLVAITTYFDPLTLRVSPSNPVVTDPGATVAWSGSLSPEFKADVSFKTLLGRGSGDSIQMFFSGEGFVVVQPVEEIVFRGGS
jgi:uncharacterized protein (AIM24 family)